MRAAFAVLLLADPSRLLADFRKSIVSGRLAGPQGTFLAVFDRRGYIHAVVRGRTEARQAQRARLRVTDVTHGDSLSTTLMLEMIRALEAYARMVGCGEIAIEAERAGRGHGLPLSDVLTSCGFCGEKLVMARRCDG